MIIYEVQQGSTEWNRLRAGVVTASMFATARSMVGQLTDQQAKYVDALIAGDTEAAAKSKAGYKSTPRAKAIDAALAGKPIGDYSDASKKYAFRLAVERISGEPLDEGFSTWAMKRGQELEPEARIRHEEKLGKFVKQVGFMTTDDNKFGVSVDSLIDDDDDGEGGGEYKCFVDPDKIRAIVIDDNWGDIPDQVQGGLWLTGRKWWDMCLYCPALRNAHLDFIRKRVERDEDYIEQLEMDMIAFEEIVSKWAARPFTPAANRWTIRRWWRCCAGPARSSWARR